MKPVLLVFLTLSFLANATIMSHDHSLVTRPDHSQLARRANVTKRCKPKPASSLSPSRRPTTSEKPTPAPSPSEIHAPAKNNNHGSARVLTVQSSRCGPSGATKEPTATSGPNGSEDWLNCGLLDGGWHPPYIAMDQVITVDLDQAISSPNSPFKICASFIGLFKKYGYQYNLPPIVIASFALQESSCNPDSVGGAGEQGLMQLTKDKCGGAPGGNCKEPDFNIGTGTKFFADTLANNNGDVLLSLGQYNGWRLGLTYGEATAAASTACCRCQNNVDYLQQVVNGWWQDKDTYGWPPIGKYFNLDICN